MREGGHAGAIADVLVVVAFSGECFVDAAGGGAEASAGEDVVAAGFKPVFEVCEQGRSDVEEVGRGAGGLTPARARGGVDNGTVEPWEMREWFADFLEALNRHDSDAVRAFLHPAVRRAHLPAGSDAWIADYDDLLHGFPDWQWKRIQLLVEDDRVAAHLRGGGAHTGTFAHRPATRTRVSIASFGMYRIERGLIVEASGTDDAAQIRAAIA